MLFSVRSCLRRRALFCHNGRLPSSFMSADRPSPIRLVTHFSDFSKKTSESPEVSEGCRNDTPALEMLAKWEKETPTNSQTGSLKRDILPRVRNAPRTSSLPFASDVYMEHLRKDFEELASWDPELSEPGYDSPKRQQLRVNEFDDTSDLQEEYPFAFHGVRMTVSKRAKKGDRLMYRQASNDENMNRPDVASANLRHCFQVVDTLMDLRKSWEPENFSVPPTNIYVPERVLVNMFGSEALNHIHLRLSTGCHVYVQSRSYRDARGWRRVLLEGSAKAINIATKEFVSCIKDDDKNSKGLASITRFGDLSTAVVRPVWSRSKGGDQEPGLFRDPPLSRAQRPETWTVKTLLHYIHKLVAADVPRAPMLQQYGTESAYFEAVGDTICDLVRDQDVHLVLSSEAIRVIMRFLVQTRQLTKLHELLPTFSSLMTTRSFNELFRAASLRSDLWLFGIYVQLMKEARLKPNGWEWVQFLKCIPSPKLRTYMFTYAYELGAFNKPYLLRAALPHSLQHNFTFTLATGGSVPEYLRSVERLFGNWISEEAIHALIYVASWSFNPKAIAAIMDYCRTREVRLDDRALRAALLFFSETKRFMEGIRFFLDTVRVHRIRRSARVTQMLFYLAWRKRAYNTCRVLWRYACLDGHVSSVMEQRIRASMNDPEYDYKTLSGEFMSRIGKAVIGVDTDVLAFQTQGEEEPVFIQEDGLGYKALQKYERRSKYALECAERLIGEDLGSGEKYEPLMALEHLIWEAAERDMEWGKVEQSAEWVARNAVRVPVVRRHNWAGHNTETPNEGKLVRSTVE